MKHILAQVDRANKPAVELVVYIAGRDERNAQHGRQRVRTWEGLASSAF